MRQAFTLAIILCHFFGSAQKIQQAVDVLYKKYPQEKVVLSLSKNEFVAGETVWYKAYVLTGYEPSEISTNLYVELFDKKKVVVKQQLVPLLKGSGQGSFTLPPSMAEDVYFIRAYTQYMHNYSEAFEYLKPIPVYNTASMNRLSHKPAQWTAAAVAEGGTLLTDVPAQLAVRLYTTSSLPQSWEADLYEKGSATPMAAIDVLSAETGLVRFTPKAGKEYIVRIKDAAGKEQVIDVPKAKENGVALAVTVTGNKLEYTIYTKGVVASSAGFKVVGTIHDQLVFTATIKKAAAAVSGSIDITQLPAGVLRLTLFNASETPMNERLCFVHQQLPVQEPLLTKDTVSFSAKGLNSWQISMDTTGLPSYAAQVNDAAFPLQTNFLGDVYLSGDFTTGIVNSDWYFTDVTEIKRQALQALLITESWTRFNWLDVLANRFPVIRYPPEQYLSFQASVLKGDKLQPMRDINLVLKGKETPMQVVPLKTDSAGGFILTNLVFTDTMSVYHQANSRKVFEKDIAIRFEKLTRFSGLTRPLPSSPYETVVRKKTDTIPAAVKQAAFQRGNELTFSEKTKALKEVVITTRAKNVTKELNQKLSSGLFSSDNETVFDFINEEQTSALGYTNLLDWLQGRVPGFSTELQDGNVMPYIRNAPAEIFLDEIPVDASAITGISASDVALVKVVRGITLGIRSGGGAVMIYTRRAGQQTKSSAPSLPINTLVGYQKIPPPFIPDYSQENLRTVADGRQMLYLNNFIYPTLNKRSAGLRFYNNDSATSYQVIITGFTGDGRVVYFTTVVNP